MLTIIIPSFNGSKIIANQLDEFILWLDKSIANYEIIIVDDGSKDNGETKKVAKEYSCRYLENEKNLGKGGAVKNGVLNARGDYIIYTDVDIPFTFDSIKEFYRYLKEKEFDVVIGDRTLPQSEYFEEISWFRKLGSMVFSFIIGRLVTTGMFDTQCGLKGFSKAVAQDLFSVSRINGFAFDVELLYISLKRNYNIKRLPVVLRNTEGSSVRLLKHGLIMIKELAMIKRNHLIKRYNKKEK
tara:strand:+ start:249 stop:971 length:723 start_codon:yes stop_codon:yes gene_type:complete